MKKFLSWFIITICPILIISCSDNDNEEPVIPTQDIARNIVGTWLLSTSDAENWISYEITESSRINVEIAQNGYYGTGTGYCFIENETFSGSYTNDRGQTFYIDWIVSAIQPFEIALEIYDENSFVGDAAIYRVMSSTEVEAGSNFTPDYRGLCGTRNISDFKILDNSIAGIDAETGEIYGLKEGFTFVTFSTPNGIGALKITVSGKVKTFAEQVVGTWVYDNPTEKTWERYSYADNGYIYAQWTTSDGIYDLSESSQSMYYISDKTVSFAFNMSVGQLNMRMVTESINDFSWTYSAYNETYLSGKFTVQRVLESVTLSPEGTSLPEYQSLVGTAEIKSFTSHNDAVASVSETGEITAKTKGRTYIDVNTNKGTGVIEVIVDGGAIPVAFEDCIGKSASKVLELLGNNTYYVDNTTVIYMNYTPEIDMVGIRLDSQTGLVKGITVTYNSSVKISQVTSILDATFIPFKSQTTDTFKAYMDSSEREDATVGVTWDISELTLAYVNLATDLFTDFSVLLGMTENEVNTRMGRVADYSSDDSRNWFFFDGKGISIVSVYFTDFINNYDNVQSVVTMFDDTLTAEQITNYLKKKYPYYPEYSSDEDLIFIPEGHEMEIIYQPEQKMIMYFSTASTFTVNSRTSIDRSKAIDKIKTIAKSLKR